MPLLLTHLEGPPAAHFTPPQSHIFKEFVVFFPLTQPGQTQRLCPSAHPSLDGIPGMLLELSAPLEKSRVYSAGQAWAEGWA